MNKPWRNLIVCGLPQPTLLPASQRIGHDISGYPLDGPVPEFKDGAWAIIF